MRDVVLFGTGSALIVEYEESCRRLGALVVAAVKNRKGPSYAGPTTPVVEIEGLTPALRGIPCLCPMFAPATRRTARDEAVAQGFRFAPALVDPTAIVAASCTVGIGTFVNAGCTIGADTHIGEHVVVNRSSSIGHHVSIERFASLGPGVVLCGDVTVESGATIGAGAIVLPAVRVGRDAVVGAGAVVVADVAAGARMFGNPAKARAPRTEGPPADPRSHEAGAPVISVVIKAYNHEKYVARAIESVLEQTFEDFEIVVTDDGSTDATPQIVASFSDQRIRFEAWRTNRGISIAMSESVARARGEFVAILNSDDFAMPDRLEKQVAYLRAHPEVAAVFGVPEQVGEDGEPVAGYPGLFDVPFAHADPTNAEWLRRFFFHGNSLCAPSAMIRRTAYDELGPDDPRLALLMDLDRWVRLLERHQIHVMREPLTAFRIRADGGNASAATAQNRLRDGIESYEVFKRYRDFSPALLRRIFAPDIAEHAIDTTRPTGVWIAEVALLGTAGWHPLFALESLYASAAEPRDYERLRDLSGRVDALRLAAEREA